MVQQLDEDELSGDPVMQPRSAFKEVVFMTTLILTVGLGAWEMAYGAEAVQQANSDLVEVVTTSRFEVPDDSVVTQFANSMEQVEE